MYVLQTIDDHGQCIRIPLFFCESIDVFRNLHRTVCATVPSEQQKMKKRWNHYIASTFYAATSTRFLPLYRTLL